MRQCKLIMWSSHITKMRNYSYCTVSSIINAFEKSVNFHFKYSTAISKTVKGKIIYLMSEQLQQQMRKQTSCKYIRSVSTLSTGTQFK